MVTKLLHLKESWNDRDLGLVRYSAQHHLLQCQTNTETAPALKTPTVLPLIVTSDQSYLHAAVRQRHRICITGHALLLAVVGAGGWCHGISRVDIVRVNRFSPWPMPGRKMCQIKRTEPWPCSAGFCAPQRGRALSYSPSVGDTLQNKLCCHIKLHW